MRMQHRSGVLVVAVDRRMQAERRYLHRAGALHDLAVEVAQQQTAGRDLGPEQAFGIDEEQVLGTRREHTVVIAYALLVVEARGPPQGRGEVDARLRQRLGHRLAPPFSRDLRMVASEVLS